MNEEKIIKWSYSGLKDFEGCAKRYHEVKVLKNYPFVENDFTRYGTEVHASIEAYGKGEAEFDPKYAQFKPIVDALLAKPGRKLYEHEMGATQDLQPCAFKADNVWCRGIADLLIIDDDNLTARVVDWKTGGNKYPDLDQMTLMSLLVFLHFPHIRSVSSALFFLVKGTMNKQRITRDQANGLWQRYRERVAKLVAAHSYNVWTPNRTPLCGWCPVTTCPHNPKH